MTEADIAKIESALGLTLPTDYRCFLTEEAELDGDLDDTTALREADSIIESTLEYRQGFAGLPPWPQHWLYVGDEADACPYVLDCQNGRLLRTDKGNLHRPPLDEYPSFADFAASRENTAIEIDDTPDTWRERIRSWLVMAAALLLVFVVLPAVAFSIKLLYRWLIYGEVPRYEP
jgi:hypothetical protein